MAKHIPSKKKTLITGVTTAIFVGIFIAIAVLLIPDFWSEHQWEKLAITIILIWINGTAASIAFNETFFMPYLRDLILAYDMELGMIPAYLEDVWFLFKSIHLHIIFNWGFLISQWIALIYLTTFEESNLEIVKKISEKDGDKK